MKIGPLLSLLAAILVLVSRLSAADPAAPAPAASVAATTSPTDAKLKDLIGRIMGKLETGKRTEGDFSAELAEFGPMAAAARPDEAAMVILMQARLYLEVFQDPAKGVAVLKQIVADYPATDIAPKLGPVIADIEAKMTAQSVLAIGSVFPALGEADLDGKPLDLSAYAGKVVLIDFWATWCGPCIAELPNVTAAYQKYHAMGFEIIGISLDKNREALTEFLQKNPMPWRHYFDGLGWQNKISTRLGIDSIPATFLLDGTGKIIAQDLRGDELDQKLAALLAPKQP